MGYYNIRDWLGHFVRPKSRQGGLCPHKCCNGKRVHPPDKPLMPNKALLRAMSDTEFEHTVRTVDWSSPRDVETILAEAERRDRREAARRRGAQTQAERRRNERLDFEVEIEAKYLQAEHTTRGDLLSRAGKAAGVDPRTLFYGPEARARKYASEELNAWFDRHGRLTLSEYRRGRARPRPDSPRPAARARSSSAKGKRAKR